MSIINLCEVFNCEELLVKEFEFTQNHTLSHHIPIIDNGYIFEQGLLNDILLYLAHPLRDCLYLLGPSGCGKTSVIHQVASRLGWGVEQVTLSNKSESFDLIGHQTLRHGNLVFEYGPLTNAMIYGEILILNEIDLMSPGDLAALNDVLEGRPLLIIANNGEIVYPHKNFRVVATANTQGLGDQNGFYNGARILNQAFLDRFRFVEVDYMQPNVEKVMLKKNCPNLDEDISNKLVRFAKELRDVLKKGDEIGINQLSAPFSSRTLLKIASIISLDYKISIQKAVDCCFALRLPLVEREYVRRLCNDIFGHENKKAVVDNNLKEESSTKQNLDPEDGITEEKN